ncbi:unnamed protein product [Adineta steineri]|uniref:DUF4371 domain-containing protein n=1 Tax=Adineta steineri TaxID=433720 RepID=A0A814Q727_9BILA|nr:unnamed protein product [Adineta steineri]CAF1115765.1 unnamed protein product [Adineta steineri]
MDDNFTSKSTVLHFETYNKRHLASNIATKILKCLQELGIQNKITSVTANDANNMLGAFDCLRNVDRF